MADERRRRVSAVLVEEAEGGESLRTYTHVGLFAPLADRVAFERRFGLSATVLSRLDGLLYRPGDPEVEADPGLLGRLRPDADPSQVREEWVAFMVWRVLRRSAAAGSAVGDFEAFLERLVDLSVEELEESPEEDARPTGPGPLAAASPSSP
ncbi:MAG TPA: hypothetical protein VNO79_08770 [Actinomycetota bacterium]|nr:hypothetical protein [Actinomycetota bacterium]